MRWLTIWLVRRQKGATMKDKVKILYVVEAMAGGVFTYLTELIEGIEDEFEIILAMSIRPNTPKDYRKYFSDKVRVIEMKNMNRHLSIGGVFKSIREIKAIADEVNPDIIHLHSSIAGAIGRMAFRKKDNILYTPHGYSFLMEDMSGLQKAIFKLVEKMLGRKRYLTVACGKSEWEAGKNIAANNIFISNGVNLEEIDDIKKHRSNNGAADEIDKIEENTVFTLGRIVKQKNPKLFNEIAKAMPDYKFVWIGDGDLRDKLDSPNIEITERKKKMEAIEEAFKYDIFLLTSRWEGLPIALLEAMYMKKFCVVSNIVGNRDVVIDGGNGFLCNTKDEFVDRLKQVLEHKINKEKMIEIAYQTVTDNYNNTIFCNKYKKLYLEVFQGR